MTTESANTPLASNFDQLGLPQSLIRALRDVGYETPSPIQAQTIPILMKGGDLIGQAQTGTGKTAAFALPILAQIDPNVHGVQALVLAPTRELAIQVAEAFQKYATHIPNFFVAPIYGGQGYGPQLHALKRGAQVVVGTPGRVIDHMEKGTLKLDKLRCLVLDEADEMLRMGFIDDVESVLKATPPTRQVALFSATMPPPIKKIANKYLRDAEHIAIASQTRTAENIRARVLFVPPAHKLEAFTRLLEVENFEGMIVFMRTKSATNELADKLTARGFAAAAINGDLPQAQRERVIDKLKNGQLDILVATDVAARGLDVERITHVVNYDLPNDAESYVHRIGRTGRAGRHGEAILFATPRERGWLKVIERSTRQTLEEMKLPSIEAVNDRRISKLIEKIAARFGEQKLEPWRELAARLGQEMMLSADDMASTVLALLKGEGWLLKLDHDPLKFSERPSFTRDANDRSQRGDRNDRAPRGDRSDRVARPGAERGGKPERYERSERAPARERSERSAPARATFEADGFGETAPRESKPRVERAEKSYADKPRRVVDDSFEGDTRPRKRVARGPEPGMRSFRLEVGHMHNVKPGNIVGAIANELGLESNEIGRIEIEDSHTTVDLPDDLTKAAIKHLQKVWVAGRALNATPLDEYEAKPRSVERDDRPPVRRVEREDRGPPRGAPRGGDRGPPRRIERDGGGAPPKRSKGPPKKW